MREVFARRLREAEGTNNADAIQTLGFYFAFYWRKAETIAQVWFEELLGSGKEKKLFFWHVASDAILTAMFRRKDASFSEAFSPVLKQALAHILVSDGAIQEPVRRVVNFWRTRRAFATEFLDELDQLFAASEQQLRDVLAVHRAAAIPAGATATALHEQLAALEQAVACRRAAEEAAPVQLCDADLLAAQTQACADDPLAARQLCDQLHQQLTTCQALAAAHRAEHEQRARLEQLLRALLDSSAAEQRAGEQRAAKIALSVDGMQRALSVVQQYKKNARDDAASVADDDNDGELAGATEKRIRTS